MQSKNNILLIEDDNNFRDLVADFIKEHGYQVVTACDGEQAKDVLKNTAVDLIISDVKMPEVNGLEFLEWVRNVYDRSFKNDTEIPVVLITGFKNSTETKKATDMGVKACLTKPFKTKELIAAVNQAIQGEDLKQEDIPQQLENNTPKFCRVSLEDFVADREIEMDVYVKITDDKFVKIANQGGKIDLNRIENYRK